MSAPDVVVVGAGPAAMAVAAECAVRGLRTVGVAPGGPRPWETTYGAWTDEVASDLLRHTWSDVRVQARGEHTLGRSYSLIDNGRLFSHFMARGADVQWRDGVVTGAAHDPQGTTVTLRDGSEVRARLVIDASGHRPALVPRVWRQRPAYQVAYGQLARFDRPPVTPGSASWMDYRHDFLTDEDFARTPTFLYAMHLGEDRYFVEETSLVTRTPPSFEALRARLERRLAWQGTPAAEVLQEERVLFPMNAPLPDLTGRVVGFGAAASMVHPGSGFMVARALSLAPGVANAASAALGGPQASPERTARAAWNAVWPLPAREAHLLHLFGVEALMALPGPALESFFAAFFALPPASWHAYLSRTASPTEVVKLKLALFARAPLGVQLPFARAGLRDAPTVLRALRHAF